MIDIKKQLPHGACIVIAQRVKVSVCTVSEVLSGKRNSTRKSEILQVAAEIISDTKAKEREAIERLNAALNE